MAAGPLHAQVSVSLMLQPGDQVQVPQPPHVGSWASDGPCQLLSLLVCEVGMTTPASPWVYVGIN